LSKSDIRQRALKVRRSLTSDEVRSLSGLVAQRLFRLPEFSTAGTIATYVAKSEEVQTARLIDSALAAGKRVLVPRALPESSNLAFAEIHSISELSPGHFGVLEPQAGATQVPLSASDAVIVPVVAWDEEGNRIGYGKGYFDRALAGSFRAPKIGLAFESQRVQGVPRSPDDVALDIMVTEERVLRFRRPSP
jgi:5-formyltetrahydrofolate cyclo-ligase